MNAIRIKPARLAPGGHREAPSKSCESEAIQKMEESIAFLIGHLDKPLRASTLAARANISPSHHFALFTRYVGSSPIDYFIRLRLQCSCHLLENTGMSIKAIARRVGYVDPLYFSRLFKSLYGLAPSQYRHLKLKPESSHRVLGSIGFPPPWCAEDLVWRQGSVELDQSRGSRDRRASYGPP